MCINYIVVRAFQGLQENGTQKPSQRTTLMESRQYLHLIQQLLAIILASKGNIDLRSLC